MSYRPITKQLKERIVLILIEEVMIANAEQIDRFFDKASNRILEIVMDEINYGR